MRLTEMRVQVEKRGGGVAADGALLGLAGPEVDRVDVARQGTCGERQTSKYYGLRFAIRKVFSSNRLCEYIAGITQHLAKKCTKTLKKPV